jgi:hypothetical protein
MLHMLKSVGPTPVQPEPFDFHVFGHHNKVLRGCGFRFDKDIRMVQWFQGQLKELTAQRIIS